MNDKKSKSDRKTEQPPSEITPKVKTGDWTDAQRFKYETIRSSVYAMISLLVTLSIVMALETKSQLELQIRLKKEDQLKEFVDIALGYGLEGDDFIGGTYDPENPNHRAKYQSWSTNSQYRYRAPRDRLFHEYSNPCSDAFKDLEAAHNTMKDLGTARKRGTDEDLEMLDKRDSNGEPNWQESIKRFNDRVLDLADAIRDELDK